MSELPNMRPSSALGGKPAAVASLRGSALYPAIRGKVYFYPWAKGTLVEIEAFHLPQSNDAPGPFGFHIHEGKTCGLGGNGDAYAAAGGHFNPTDQPHPHHAGDLPVLFGNRGYGYMVAYTDRFKPKDVVGRAVILHRDPDDFRSQPSGDAGIRIACGIVQKV